jgi:hypothetical protein
MQGLQKDLQTRTPELRSSGFLLKTPLSAPTADPSAEAASAERQGQAEPRPIPWARQGLGRGLQGASVISEAGIRAENPVFIGLISMVTGLTNLEDIQRVYRQLWLQGKAILASGEGQALQNPAIISLLQKAEDPGRQAG